MIVLLHCVLMFMYDFCLPPLQSAKLPHLQNCSRASPHSNARKCGQVRRKQTRRGALRFLSLTLARLLKPRHPGFCKGGNLK